MIADLGAPAVFQPRPTGRGTGGFATVTDSPMGAAASDSAEGPGETRCLQRLPQGIACEPRPLLRPFSSRRSPCRSPIWLNAGELPVMPKMKTHKGMKKRFKISATGKVSHKRCGSSHLNSHKSGKRIRRLRKSTQIKNTAECGGSASRCSGSRTSIPPPCMRKSLRYWPSMRPWQVDPARARQTAPRQAD